MRSQPNYRMSTLTVSELTIYPVKSLRGISVQRFDLSSTGPVDDRKWMVVDNEGHFLTQRKLAAMCLIHTRLEEGRLFISRNDLGEVEVQRGGGNTLNSVVWQDNVKAEDCGDDAAQWLSTALQRECRLVYMPSGAERGVPDTTSTVGFADAYPILLAHQASLDDFNQHLSQAIAMNRFRPNLVVSGGEAWAEDEWRKLKVRDLNLEVTSPCTRCIMPAVDPETADKQMEVIDALNKHRRFGTKTRFGQNVIYANFGTISVGDRVEVVA